MNFTILRKIIGRSLSSTDKLIAITILDAIGNNQTAFCGPETIAARASFSESTVKRSLAALQNAGLIEREFKGHKAKDTWFVDADCEAWRRIESVKKVDPELPVENDKGRTQPPQACHSATPNRVTVPPYQDHEPPIEQYQDSVGQGLGVIGKLETSEAAELHSDKTLTDGTQPAVPPGDVALQQHLSFQDSFDLYNATAAQCGWRVEEHLTATHMRLFSELKNWFTAHDWAEGLSKASRSAFIAGHKRDNWPTLKWFLSDDNLSKLLEGRYDQDWSFGSRRDSRQNGTQSSRLPAEPLGFAGKIIKIGQRDFDGFQRRFSDIDVAAELEKRDGDLVASGYDPDHFRSCDHFLTSVENWLSVRNGRAANQRFKNELAIMEAAA